MYSRSNAFSSVLSTSLLLLILMLFGALVRVEHHRSRDRPGLGGYVADLTLDESALFAALGKLAVESLEAFPLIIYSCTRDLSSSKEAPSIACSNLSFSADLAHCSDREGGPSRSEDSSEEERSARGSRSRACASFCSVPKCGRVILPVSIPETVVGLTPASLANLLWVHSRRRRILSKRTPM